MTDIHHSSDLLPGLDQARASSSWVTIIGAALALFLALGVPHLTMQNASDGSQFQNSENSAVNLDGRGKWVGYIDTSGRVYRYAPFETREEFCGVYPMQEGIALLFGIDGEVEITEVIEEEKRT